MARQVTEPQASRGFGTDTEGNAYIAVAGQEEHYLTNSRDALRTLIRDIKAGKADHLL
ncbi:hypothetical protein [Streptomyces sp. PSKA30]|uniref:hypothetical protein n=1 Tax=Streptomyces sp. PSKA30 TaxID=2874597 RepID=UPI001CD087F3|nr:hypothetical protein [Streptomyces sp. PSKA30]MBZ9643397.1 hypothetical protein [Streptomyces sp. PSKA30]